MIIGIAGGSGSGKSSLARNLMNLLNDRKVVYIPQDAYYKDQSIYSEEEREKINYDSPHVLDLQLLSYHLNELRNNRSIQKPIYDFLTHTRRKECELVLPGEIIVVEGTLIFTHCRLRHLVDYKIFLYIPADARLARRILRDTRERGRNVETVIKQWFDSVEPMYEKYVARSKRYADIVLAKDPAQVDLELLALKMREDL
jgi:uridine kinase